MYDRNNIMLDKLKEPKGESKVIILSLPHFLLMALRMSHSLNFLFISLVTSHITLLVPPLLPNFLPWNVSEARIPSFILMSVVSKFTLLVISSKFCGFDYCLYLNGSQNYLQSGPLS